jgi:amino acid permease
MDFEKQDSSKESVNRRIFSNESLQAEGLFPSTDVGQFGETHRGLKSRHIQFLALGTYHFISLITWSRLKLME